MVDVVFGACQGCFSQDRHVPRTISRETRNMKAAPLASTRLTLLAVVRRTVRGRRQRIRPLLRTDARAPLRCADAPPQASGRITVECRGDQVPSTLREGRFWPGASTRSEDLQTWRAPVTRAPRRVRLSRQMNREQRVDYTVDAVDKAIGLLNLVEQFPDLGVTELAKRSGNTKARAFRLLGTLELNGLVQRDANAAYRLGTHVLYLGAAAQEQLSIVRVSSAIFDEMIQECNEGIQIRIRDG